VFYYEKVPMPVFYMSGNPIIRRPFFVQGS